jgi:hypothetical protein
MIDAHPAWTCPTCGSAARETYCAACGERRFAPAELTLGSLGAQAAESLTNADGRVFRTFKALLMQPGELTLAYAQGRRKSYIGPFQLFVLANVLFFLLQSALGFHALSNTLTQHLEGQVYSARAQSLAADRLAALGTTLEAFAPVFDSAVTVNAKALVALLVPVYALLIFAMFFLSRRPVVVHCVFALHFVAFWLIALAFLVPLIALPLSIVFELIGLSNAAVDGVATWLLIALSAVYAYRAFGRVYGGAAWSRVARAVVLAVVFIPVIRLYRFAVFLITLYTA